MSRTTGSDLPHILQHRRLINRCFYPDSQARFRNPHLGLIETQAHYGRHLHQPRTATHHNPYRSTLPSPPVGRWILSNDPAGEASLRFLDQRKPQPLLLQGQSCLCNRQAGNIGHTDLCRENQLRKVGNGPKKASQKAIRNRNMNPRFAASLASGNASLCSLFSFLPIHGPGWLPPALRQASSLLPPNPPGNLPNLHWRGLQIMKLPDLFLEARMKSLLAERKRSLGSLANALRITLSQRRGDGGVDLPGRGYRILQLLQCHRDGRFAGEWNFTGEHFIKDNPSE